MAKKDKDKDNLEETLARLQKKFSREAIGLLGDSKNDLHIERVSSGSIEVDKILGGGLPKGRIVEFFGPPGGGKSTLALHVVAEAQANGEKAAWIDAEYAFDPGYAKSIGVDTDALIFCQPSSGEEGWDIATELIKTGEIGVVVVDSIPHMTPAPETELDLGESRMGLHAKLVTQAMRGLLPACSHTGGIVLCINQIRANLSGYGANTDTPGGHALKHSCSVRMEIRRVGAIKVGDSEIGNRTQVKTVKNRVAPPYRKCEFDLIFGEGVDRQSEVIDGAVALGLMKKSGAWYSIDGENIAQGREGCRKWLKEHPEMYGSLRAAILSGATTEVVENTEVKNEEE